LTKIKKRLELEIELLYDIGMLRQKVEAELENIRVGLKTEGGDIELVDVREGVVYVRLMGACGTCPMSELTMKNWVEMNLKKAIPEITGVKAV
jgi:Fe-S cluster biogenesis protein NfuA